MDLDLNQDAPDKIPGVLYKAADAYNESAEDLSASWQDKNAGRPWRIIAKIMVAAAEKIERALNI